MKRILFLTVLAFFFFSCEGRAEAIKVTSKPEKVAQYEPFILKISLPYHFENPSDPENVKLEVGITIPSGRNITMPAFCYRNKKGGEESLWEVRFTPAEKGRYIYFIKLQSPKASERTPARFFDVNSGKGKGFLRKGKDNPFYPVFDSGEVFFGLGHNIGWTSGNSVEAFEAYFKDFEKSGCNLTRIWTNVPWALPIENIELGAYNEKNCDKLDTIIKLAEKYGVYVILVLDSYGALMHETGEWNENVWKDNPYNKAKGGPCEKPEDFFKNETAKRYYKNRLRYVISRWSYSPNVASFELWNEMDIPRGWAKEILAYIKETNPHGQLLTTSLGYPWGNNFDEHWIWGLRDMDIVQWHVYGERVKDVVGNLISINRRLSSIYYKPILAGEFSMDSSVNDKSYDPNGEGVSLHNSIWAAALTRSFSGPLNWWWAGYVRGKNLYHHYQALRNFIKDIDWGARKITFIDTTPVVFENLKRRRVSYSDIRIPTVKKWGDTTFKEFIIENNGDVKGGLVNGYLHGRLKSKFKITPVFHVDYPADGKFVIRVDTVSQGGRLIVFMDGKEVLSKDFPVGTGEGPWQRSLFRRDKDIFQCVYNTDVEINVPRGKHTIRLENIGKDWIGIKRVILKNYKSDYFANARVLGLAVGKEMLFWAQNKDYNWRNVYNNEEIPEIKGASFSAEDVEDGVYKVEWWDTFQGKVVSRENVSTKRGTLSINLPDFTKDIACKARKR
ncbi:MAG: DUF5060 domain-containing protein [Candidatus Omnitrophota bacterium]|jgi:hypothetical protein